MYILDITIRAKKHLDFWKISGQKNILNKINALFEELEEHPRTGTGKPEQLKGDFSGFWSRKIDKKNRIIYKVDDENVVVLVVAAKGHYEFK
ncbi:MAG: Txe/YoeB family addiction module toxin [Prevotellaceae bacterium]|jgi:toxin YoeB|nr:Txe/YoeB family addiction module toxin [Prevotellaceae bacterium]